MIVESPTKARKLAGYLGSSYIVESSRGHIRDLPRAAADVPAKYKSEPWARLGVNVDADFEPLYIISPEKSTRSPSSGTCSRVSTSSTWPRTVTARAKPSPGTCWKP